ncbi:MAG: hypothetical protein HPY45_17685 [Anaerolineae bacterium]|nr:hypothetical protein [Anaerolineae bacterium]
MRRGTRGGYPARLTGAHLRNAALRQRLTQQAGTLVAAILHNRRAVGCEKEPLYAEVARQRVLACFNGSLRRRPMGKPVYQPTGREKVSQIPAEWQDLPQPRLCETPGEYGVSA